MYKDYDGIDAAAIARDYEMRRLEQDRISAATRDYLQDSAPIEHNPQDVDGLMFRLPGDKPTALHVGCYALLMLVTGVTPENGGHDIHWFAPMRDLEGMKGNTVVWDEGHFWRWDSSISLWAKLEDSEIECMVLRMNRCYSMRGEKKVFAHGSAEFSKSCLLTVMTVVKVVGFFQRSPLAPEVKNGPVNGHADGWAQIGTWLYLHRGRCLSRRRPLPADAQRFRLEFEMPVMVMGTVPANPCESRSIIRMEEGIWHDAMPNFCAFLDSILPDLQAQELLRTFFGLGLLGLSAQRQEHLWLAGTERGRNGKGTLCAILKLILGEHLYCGFDDKMASHEYLRSHMMRSRLCVIPEMGDLKPDCLEWLKKPTGGDTLQYRDVQTKALEGVCMALFIGCSNWLPFGINQALLRRFWIIDLDQEIKREQVIPWAILKPRIEPELPLIVLWMLQAVSGYVDGLGELPPCNASDRLRASLLQSSNFLSRWFDRYLVHDPSGKLDAEAITRAIRPHLTIYNDQQDDPKRRESLPIPDELGRRIAQHLKRASTQSGDSQPVSWRSNGITHYRARIVI